MGKDDKPQAVEEPSFNSFRDAFEAVGLEAATKAWTEGRVDMPEIYM